MPKRIDYDGKKIGRVLVLSLVKRGNGGSIWNCKCDCGNLFECWNANFKRGEKFECTNCILERRRGPDLTGRKYGRWTVLKRTMDSRNKTVWHCRCDCGNEGYVSTSALGKKSKSMSCGCWGRKMKSKWANTSLYPKASGLSTTKFYRMRTQLIHKCYCEKWPTYNIFGAKGITVCELWRNSAKDMYDWAIESGWKEGTCIVLKEGAKIFSPENVYLIEYNDLRGEISKNHGQKITYKGETLSVSEWSTKLGINLTSLRNRLIKFPSIEEAFEAPYRKTIFLNNPGLKKEAIKMFLEVRNYKKVAKHFGVCSSALQYHIRQAGLDPKWNRLNIKDEDILKLMDEGKTKNEIAKIFNTSWTCINHRINRMQGIARKR